MAVPPPTPEHVARWLLDHEAGPAPPPDALAAAADRIYARLRAGLVVYVGATGFDALWARAMFLAHGPPPPDPPSAAAPRGSLPPGVPPVVGDQDPLTARARVLASVASFITLLFMFVGAPLGRRLLSQLWPALPVAAPDSHSGDTTE